jgi:hypothetical protein
MTPPFWNSLESTKSISLWSEGLAIFFFKMAHAPQTMSELYSHLHEELRLRLDEAERGGYGFVLRSTNVSVVPNVPKLQQNMQKKKLRD